jgi:hypothetical protein
MLLTHDLIYIVTVLVVTRESWRRRKSKKIF